MGHCESENIFFSDFFWLLIPDQILENDQKWSGFRERVFLMFRPNRSWMGLSNAARERLFFFYWVINPSYTPLKRNFKSRALCHQDQESEFLSFSVLQFCSSGQQVGPCSRRLCDSASWPLFALEAKSKQPFEQPCTSTYYISFELYGCLYRDRVKGRGGFAIHQGPKYAQVFRNTIAVNLFCVRVDFRSLWGDHTFHFDYITED